MDDYRNGYKSKWIHSSCDSMDIQVLQDLKSTFQPSINEEQIHDFTTLRFLEKQENIVF